MNTIIRNHTLRVRVIRPKDTVIVKIMKFKEEEKYSFVNMTKGHICPCKFDSVEEAFADLMNLKREGKIIDFEVLEDE